MFIFATCFPDYRDVPSTVIGLHCWHLFLKMIWAIPNEVHVLRYACHSEIVKLVYYCVKLVIEALTAVCANSAQDEL